MTDLEKFVELYKSLGVNLEVATSRGGKQELLLKAPAHYEDDQWEKFTGYLGFYSSIVFDKDGKFIEQGFWK